ncbi:MAG: Hpt domain-containing protein [Rubrivivax sp.]|nr:Hpt domain-containing protein [Rubrivivax sp.]
MFKSSPCRLHVSADDHGSPGPAPGGPAATLLDALALDRLRQLDPDGSRGFLSQVLSTYRQSLERHLALLSTLSGEGALKPVGDAAHTLKSSSASVGALDFSRLCAQVESLARAGDPQALAAPLSALRAEGERVLDAVRDMLSR